MMLSVGQKLWYVPVVGYGQPHEVGIVKIGRVWATLGGFERRRIRIDDLTADGGDYSSPGRCWLSREEWEHEMAAIAAWDKFRRVVSQFFSMPPELTRSKIVEAAALLGLDIPGE